MSSPWEPQRDSREGHDTPAPFVPPGGTPSSSSTPSPDAGQTTGQPSEPYSSDPYGPSPYALEPYADPYAADRAHQQQQPYAQPYPQDPYGSGQYAQPYAQPYAQDPYSAYPAASYTPYPQGPYTPASYSSYPTGPAVSGLAVAALVCGILGFFTAGVASIAAVICGHLAWRETSSGQNTGHGMTIAGLVLGYIPIVGWILFWLFFFVVGVSSL
ncbi:DUF4190 domain-containing protein [Actinomycetospora succinea]|uniref:DUF4190 domain-containing protein n=1 Tax=Actinomycetospora succinea TaxID=663603 RepID=UPI00105C0279|nr:DUF4190 domain-containing protein [Actinomycetospora succinea]